MFASCKAWCNPEKEEEIIDWSSSSENIVAGTLKREDLLYKLQQLEDSKSSESAEIAIQAINDALAEEDELYLKWMQRAGSLSIIQEVLQREEEQRPSLAAAAPLLQKLGKYSISKTARKPRLGNSRRLVTYIFRRS